MEVVGAQNIVESIGYSQNFVPVASPDYRQVITKLKGLPPAMNFVNFMTPTRR